MDKAEKWKKQVEKSPNLVDLTTPKMTKYIPHVPTPKQAAFMLLPHQEALYGGSAGGGKAAILSTLIPTPCGFKRMGEMKVGDVVFDENGNQCNVVGVSEIFYDHDCYEMTFDTGEKIIVDAGHLWPTATDKERTQYQKSSEEARAKRRANRPSRGTGKRPDIAARNAAAASLKKERKEYTIKTTKEIAETVTVYHGKTPRVNHSIKIAKPLSLPEIKLPVDPYTLGAWLGDGTTSAGVITNHHDDIHIIRKIESSGYEASKHKDEYVWGILGLMADIRKSGVLHDKRIPEIYFRASEKQRWELLYGLMDTDGTCDKDGGAEISLSKPDLAQDVIDLARSLGLKVFYSVCKSFLNGEQKQDRTRIKITTNVPLFTLPRKLERQNLENRKTQDNHYIVSCVKVETQPTRCIQVDSPSRLYLCTKSMIPTHNSDCILMCALQYVDVPDYNALIIRRTYADLEKPDAIMDRAKKWMAPWAHEVKWSEKKRKFTFPSGATISFGYLSGKGDLDQYQGAQYQFVGFDELTQFEEDCYLYLFSRIRRTEGTASPGRMRAASNPGGIGAKWVKQRFLESKDKDRCFIQAGVKDNPHLVYEEYVKMLSVLDETTRRQLLDGDWEVQKTGLVYPTLSSRFPKGAICNKFDRFKGKTYGGIDWGYSGPSCFLCGTLDDQNVLWVWYERYMRGKTIQEHMDEIPNDGEIVWFADPAQPELIQQMRNRDFIVRKAPNSKQAGINTVQQLIKTGRLRISENCTHIIEEADLYRYRDDRDIKEDVVSDPNKVSEEPYKQYDHSMDALRYMCAGIAKYTGNEILTPIEVAEKAAVSAAEAAERLSGEKNRAAFKISKAEGDPEIDEEELRNWRRIDNEAFW